MITHDTMIGGWRLNRAMEGKSESIFLTEFKFRLLEDKWKAKYNVR